VMRSPPAGARTARETTACGERAAPRHRDARRRGWDWPGLCLLRLAGGHRCGCGRDPPCRGWPQASRSARRSFPPIEIMLAVGAVDDGAQPARPSRSRRFRGPMLAASLAQAKGQPSARRRGRLERSRAPIQACRAWQGSMFSSKLRACPRALGPHAARRRRRHRCWNWAPGTCSHSWGLSRTSLARGLARPGRRRSELPWALAARAGVLRLVAGGATNKAIAASLFLSDERSSLSATFLQLRAPSRSRHRVCV
jgi:hypothetical protein